MLAHLIEWSGRNRVLVLLLSLFCAIAGLLALRSTPLDALPDLSDVQVIVYTEFPGQSPQLVEDQLTYPLSNALLAVPQARAVRGFSYFGASFVYVIFADGSDPYWARSRVLESLNAAAARLPAGLSPTLGPDASGVGWVYEYALLAGQKTLAELRTLQDWTLRLGLAKAQGVAEVASVGGFVQTYQVTVEPHKLRAYGLTLARVSEALRSANRDAGARVIELAEAEYMVRGRGYLRDQRDIEDLVLKSEQGRPVRVRDIARVELVPDERRGLAELDGTGEVVAGIAVARHGQNALAVIEQVKARLGELAAALPPGVEIRSVYDRSELILRAIATLQRTLLEEGLIVAAVCLVFLLHARSALVAMVMLPVGLLIAFIAMRLLGVNANLMSLGGIAIAMGAMVDAAIVMVENAHKHLERKTAETSQAQAILAACKEVGPALFFSLLIITVSFLPVFTLEAQEGRLFAPLAYTKTFAMAGAALLSVTLVPVLMLLFIRGPIRPEARNPLNRWLVRAYRPLIDAVLRHPRWTLALAVLAMGLSVLPARRLGSEFMPTLNEGSLLYMPTTLPSLSVTKAAELLQTQDKIIKSFPEVEQVFGKAGRAGSATDPAPLEMFETLITLKPASAWRPGLRLEQLIAEMDQALQFPGVSNAWTMPIKSRIDMLATGIRTPVGVKVLGHDLAALEGVAKGVEAVLKQLPGTSSAYAERSSGGLYLNINPRREQLARYGLGVGDVMDLVASALGGERVSTLVQGRERYGVQLRYPRDLRNDPARMASEIWLSSAQGAQIQLGQVAEIEIAPGAPSVRSENGWLATYVYVDLRESDIGGYVARARQAVAEQVKLPPGTYLVWSGQFEAMERVAARMQIVVPVTLLIIFLLLYLNFGRFTESLIVMLSVPFAAIGGIWLVWALDYQLSVAVAVGFIALAGVAAETGVVMLMYLDQAWQDTRQRLQHSGQTPQWSDLYQAVIAGAVERVRPKIMTVVAIMAGLLPILWSSGTGSELMRRIAAPMVGGMLSSTVLTLLVIPVLYAGVKRWELGRG